MLGVPQNLNTEGCERKTEPATIEEVRLVEYVETLEEVPLLREVNSTIEEIDQSTTATEPFWSPSPPPQRRRKRQRETVWAPGNCFSYMFDEEPPSPVARRASDPARIRRLEMTSPCRPRSRSAHVYRWPDEDSVVQHVAAYAASTLRDLFQNVGKKRQKMELT
ncbi:MAG: hypothetical protein KVP17_001003 [Porospora cf. gigantea B]|uniref:uncharacterized protein n=1 Tax=Porospora cf. gigantea B TaxID=2853592 RepID=UPI003571D3B5|nr:MAG: hypothetical protein KVP17_001003 [Porospora cf. gigantea B]